METTIKNTRMSFYHQGLTTNLILLKSVKPHIMSSIILPTTVLLITAGFFIVDPNNNIHEADIPLYLYIWVSKSRTVPVAGFNISLCKWSTLKGILVFFFNMGPIFDMFWYVNNSYVPKVLASVQQISWELRLGYDACCNVTHWG